MDLVRRPSSRGAAADSFLASLVQCYRMGDRMAKSLPFREGSVRRAKKRLRDELRDGVDDDERHASRDTSPGLPNADSMQLDSLDDRSFASPRKSLSCKDSFHCSWPSHVTMKCAECPRSWSVSVERCCPFCKPHGKVSSVDELMDHLNTFHPQFTYEAFSSECSATIYMKLNRAHGKLADPMPVTDFEEYFFSMRIRARFPEYCRVTEWDVVDYPFIVRKAVAFARRRLCDAEPVNVIDVDAPLHCQPSNAVGGVPPLQQQRVDSNQIVTLRSPFSAAPATNFNSSRKPPPSPAIRARSTKPFASIPCSSKTICCGTPQNNISAASTPIAPPPTTRRPMPQRTSKTKALQRNMAEETIEVPDIPVLSRRKRKRNANRNVDRYKNPLKERMCNDPKGMKNSTTKHLRASMFGELARLRTAGFQRNPQITPEAADGRLFHSTINLPIDAEKYNRGVDSDDESDGAELQMLLRHNEHQLNELVDVPAIDKYFLSLWDQFVNREVRARNDRAVFQVVLRFVTKFGAEIKRMMLEAHLAAAVNLFWEMGLLDADGLMYIMQSFRDCDSFGVGPGQPHPEFAVPQKVMREEHEPFKETHEYKGLRKVTLKTTVSNRTGADWIHEEQRKARAQRRGSEMAARGLHQSDDWMAKLFDEGDIQLGD